MAGGHDVSTSFSLAEQLQKFWAKCEDTEGAKCACAAAEPPRQRRFTESCAEEHKPRTLHSPSPPEAPPAHKPRALQRRRRGRGHEGAVGPVAVVASPQRRQHKQPAPVARARGQNGSDAEASGLAGKIRQGTVELREAAAGRRCRSPSSSSSSTSTSRARSGSGNRRGSRAPSPKAPAARSPKVRRRIGQNWDQTPSQALALATAVVKPPGEVGDYSKKRREVYCGNLAVGRVTQEGLKQAFKSLFHALPCFRLTYPDVEDPVRGVAFPGNAQGMFAFVEMYDEVLANTAIQMSGFEFCGRAVKVGRPAGFVPRLVGGDLAALDVEPLRKCSILPLIPEVTSSCGTLAANKFRELYFGNLLLGSVNEKVMVDLLTPTCMLLPGYDPQLGPPITKVTMSAQGSYCFVQFQSPEMVPDLIAIFHDTELFGRPLKVGRPSNLEGHAAQPPSMAPGTLPLSSVAICPQALQQLALVDEQVGAAAEHSSAFLAGAAAAAATDFNAL